MFDRNGIVLKALRNQLAEAIEQNNGLLITDIAVKIALYLEELLEEKATAKALKNQEYARIYDQYREKLSQKDAEIKAKAEQAYRYDQIEALESGIKSILSTVKDKLKWLELENQNKF